MENKNCFYCDKGTELENLMIEVAKLEVSTLFLNKDQTHKGRCIVAFDRHVKELFQLGSNELSLFIKDVSDVAKIIDGTFHPDKLNYGIYGDIVSHLHVHLVPKYQESPEWGDAFINSPEKKSFLSDKEYKDIIRNIQQRLLPERQMV
jgi:diadenosine tetraphosphate (Ap4A) HIT family hydrolase